MTRGANRAVVVLGAVAVLRAGASAAAQDAFPQGVASGDVTATRAVCWTRTTSAGSVRLEISPAADPQGVMMSLDFIADSAADYTVKADVSGLAANTRYTYRFTRLDTQAVSPAGQFRTAPADDQTVAFRFVYSGDSNAERRPFHLLDAARDESPDFWIYAGDTIYGDFPADGLGEVTDLAGYRAKYRQNREDAALRGLLSASACVAQWDDHEIANDYDGGDPEPGITAERIAAGYQAFFEFMPIRDQAVAGDARRVYRSFRHGALAEFFVLDCRQYRSADAVRNGGPFDPYGYFIPPRDDAVVAQIEDGSRTMLGAEQAAWLRDGLLHSTATWKFVCSSMPLTSLLLYPYDRWDGYEAERRALLQFIDDHAIGGVVFLSADIHGNLFNPDVAAFSRNVLHRPLSAGLHVPEFVAGPIGMATFRQEALSAFAPVLGLEPDGALGLLLADAALGIATARVTALNGLRYVELDRYSYLVMEVSADGLTGVYRGIPAYPVGATAAAIELHREFLPPPGAPMCGVVSPLLLALSAAVVRPRRRRASRSAG